MSVYELSFLLQAYFKRLKTLSSVLVLYHPFNLYTTSEKPEYVQYEAAFKDPLVSSLASKPSKTL